MNLKDQVLKKFTQFLEDTGLHLYMEEYTPKEIEKCRNMMETEAMIRYLPKFWEKLSEKERKAWFDPYLGEYDTRLLAQLATAKLRYKHWNLLSKKNNQLKLL